MAKKTRTPAGPGYVVRRLNWQEPIDNRYFRLPGWHDLATFPTLEAAVADRGRREAFARDRINPFACGRSVFELSTLPRYALSDWLTEAGLSPPPFDAPLSAWEAWWAAARPEMSADQADRAWAGFDKLRFFEVAEQPAGDAIHVVLQVDWRRDQYWRYFARFEGGHPVYATRDRTAAERQIAGPLRERWEMIHVENEYEPYTEEAARLDAERDEWPGPAPEPRSRTNRDCPVGRVVSVTGPAKPRKVVFLLIRIAWSWRDGQLVWDACTTVDRTDFTVQACGVPLAAFATRDAAAGPAWELDFVARMTQNPFRFGRPADLTSIPLPVFGAMLADAGLAPPPTDEQPAWADWWDATADFASAAQRDAVWDLLDQLRFFAVIELPLQG